MSPIIKSIAITILLSIWILALRDILKQEMTEDRAVTKKSHLITSAFKYAAIIGGSVALLAFVLFWND